MQVKVYKKHLENINKKAALKKSKQPQKTKNKGKKGRKSASFWFSFENKTNKITKNKCRRATY